MKQQGDIIRISRHTPEWHEPFFAHAEAAFSIDFRQWARHLGWSRSYEVLAHVEGGRILSTIGMTRMAFSLADSTLGADFRRLVEGIQLGSVATVTDRRGEGLGGGLMRRVLAEADRRAQPVMLFAGAAARDYYPRFGFRLLPSCRYRWPLAVLPAEDAECRPFDVTSPRDRDRLRGLFAGNASHGGGLSARPDASVLLWYLFNTQARALFLEGGRALVFVEEEGGTLHIREWLGRKPASLLPVLPLLATRPASRVAFGFIPLAHWLPAGLAPEPDPESLLFQRGLDPGEGVPVCFPDFLRT